TIRVSVAESSAANTAEEKLMREATVPNGTSEIRCASITHKGKPGGCATPRECAANINSPLSTRVTVGARVQVYRKRAAKNTIMAQKNSGGPSPLGVTNAPLCDFVAGADIA